MRDARSETPSESVLIPAVSTRSRFGQRLLLILIHRPLEKCLSAFIACQLGVTHSKELKLEIDCGQRTTNVTTVGYRDAYHLQAKSARLLSAFLNFRRAKIDVRGTERDEIKERSAQSKCEATESEQ